MAVDLKLRLTSFLISSQHPSRKYGAVTPMPMLRNSPWSAVLMAVSVAQIPRNATVVSATLKVCQYGTHSGSATLGIRALTSAWNSGATWASRPTVSSTTTASQSRTDPVSSTQWSFDVTALVASWVAGTAANRGLQMTLDAGPNIKMRGSGDARVPPVLEVSYTLAPPAPTGLSPSSGAVSGQFPTLAWQAPEDIIEAQVQIDASPGDETPEWDSGPVATVGGQFALAGTTFPGLADGAVKVWRVRQRNDNGWSAWSSWATVARLAKPVLSLTSPVGSVVYDSTPPIQWALAGGGLQVAWRARLLDAQGRTLADSGKVAGTATDWTASSGFTASGQAGTIVVDVWDDVDREAGPGAPVVTSLSQSVTYQLDATVAPMDSIQAYQDGVSPGVMIAGTRAAGIPDEVVLFRNGVQVGRWAGVDVFVGTSFLLTDATAPMSTPATYRVAPVVNGKVAAGGPEAWIVPVCQGIWLIDETDPTRRVLVVGIDDQEQTEPEQAITHVPVSSDVPAEVVRRRLIRLPAQGSVTGTFVDALDVKATDSEAFLREFAEDDAGRIYRLVLGRKNHRVIVGDIDFAEQPIDSEDERVLAVSFSWWARA